MSWGHSPRVDKEALERLYERYNRREYVHPDPLEFLYQYEDPGDREIVALIASSLAYGRVAQILASVASVLERMGPPRRFVRQATRRSLRERFSGFRHRFTTGEALAGMLGGAGRVLERQGSLQAAFLAGLHDGDETVIPALERFAGQLEPEGSRRGRWLVATPGRGSACKRWHLFLRWMVRRDAVDPGGWDEVPASKLVVPLDTHMHRIGLALGFTRRPQADGRAAAEVTAAFRAIAPDDPVRYDFALTRLGIRPEADWEGALRQLASAPAERIQAIENAEAWEVGMNERPGAVTMKGNPLTLLGEEVQVGGKAPDFTVVDNGLAPVKLSSFQGKVCILSSVPSLDTPVCDMQTRRFNEAAGKLGPDVVVLTLSMDLPFAQKRWCGAAGVDAVQTLSDHREASFGKAYGLLIKELRLLARAVLVVDREGTIRYQQVVKEVTREPDYDAALCAAGELV